MKKLEEKFWISFLWFSYKAWKILTQAISRTDEKGLYYKKSINIISYFRDKNEDMFDLDFITNFSWYDKLNFNMSFNIK